MASLALTEKKLATTAMGPWKTKLQGVSTYLVAAFDPSLSEHSGGYLDDCQLHNDRRAVWASDPAVAKKLWELCERLVNEKLQA